MSEAKEIVKTAFEYARTCEAYADANYGDRMHQAKRLGEKMRELEHKLQDYACPNHDWYKPIARSNIHRCRLCDNQRYFAGECSAITSERT